MLHLYKDSLRYGVNVPVYMLCFGDGEISYGFLVVIGCTDMVGIVLIYRKLLIHWVYKEV